MTIDFEKVNRDKNLYAVDGLPLITVYDDNFFVRNDYDVLSLGQRQYLVDFFKKEGYVQSSGKALTKGDITVHLPAPNSNLAVSSFDEVFSDVDGRNYYCVTPTMFAETLFHKHRDDSYLQMLRQIRRLIKKCPYNIEWLRDISYRSPIEGLTQATYKDLIDYQEFIVKQRFKSKKAL